MLKQKLQSLINSSENYDDYEQKINSLKLSSKELGDAQEYFCMWYFNSHKKHYNIKKYISYIDLTENKKTFLEKFNLPSKDKGTDAVIVHTDNTFSLVQVKYRTKNTPHNRSVFDGMAIDALNCKGKIKNLYLFSNCSNISEEGFKYDEYKFKFILYDTIKDIDWVIFKNSLQVGVKKDTEVVKLRIKFREWQKNAIEFTYEELCKNKQKSISIIAPCGSGKTLYTVGAIRKLFKEDFKVLILVPTLYLLSQWYNSIVGYFDKDTNFLLVSSYSELKVENSRFNITTTEEGVFDTIRNKHKKLIVISTYQSVDKVKNVCKKFKFNLTFADEAHRTATNFSEDSNFSSITKSEFPSRLKIYLTATPKIYKGKMIEKIISMDDKKIYGEQYKYSVRNAIDDNIISDYKIILGVCEENVEEGYPDSQRYDVYAKLLLHCIKKFNLKKILVASNTHASSKKLFEVFSKMFYKENSKGFDHKLMLVPKVCAIPKKNFFISEICRNNGIIFNVRVFNLGADIPQLDTVFFNGDKNSVIDIVQTAMRCMRKHPLKETAYVIVPAFLGENLEVEGGDFPNTRNTLSAMGNQDEDLKEEILMRCKNSAKLGKKIKIKNSKILFEDFENISKIDLETIGDRLFNSITKNSDDYMWYINREKVNLMMEKKGSLSYNSKSTEEKFCAKWCQHQKTNYTNGDLSKERIKSLEEIKKWKWVEPYSFEKRCKDVNEWAKINKKIPVKKGKSDGSVEHIYGGWCDGQRQKYKKGQLTEYEIKKLEEIKFWFWKGNKTEILDMCKIVKKWIEDNGGEPKRTEDPLETKYNRWCGKQKTKYKKGQLTAEEIKEIESIKEWVWITRTAQGEKHKEVKEWIEEHERIPSSRSKNNLERTCGVWCTKMRQKYRKGDLIDEEIKELEKIAKWYWEKE